MNVKRVAVLMVAGVLASTGWAQVPEDALRLSLSNMPVGARAMGMGNAYTGIANDFSAIYWNPAGLGQMEKGEFSFGMGYQKVNNTSTFFGEETPYSVSATTVNTAGLVMPVPVRRGSLVLAFGFNRGANFANPLSFGGFNPSSSFIQTSAPDGLQYPSDLSRNWAYQLYLANIDTITGRFVSPIKNRVRQSGTVTEGGGLNDWSAAGALEVAKNLFAGVTLTYYAGTYTYDRSYFEDDINGFYNTFPFDFNKLAYDDYIHDDISGFGAKFGFLYRVPDLLRVGVAIKTPTAYHVNETFGSSASSYFDNGDYFPVAGPYREEFSNEFDVTSPWVFSGGVSLTLAWFVLTGDLEFTDWSAMEFSNAPQEVLDNNKTIRETFRSTLDYRIGAEFDVFGSGLRLRAGAGIRQSPYTSDSTPIPGDFFSTDFNTRFVTAGVGIPLGATAMFDLAYQRSWWMNYRYSYDNPSAQVDESIVNHHVVGTFSFRF
jgi:long-subunit fatty acid transport protein